MTDIESRLRAALRDSQLAPAALRQLPALELYPLVAIGGTPPDWLTQCWDDGTTVVPCHLSEASARRTSRGNAQIVRSRGRDFLESLGDRYLWIDPEGVGMVLSPQQVGALLKLAPAPVAIGSDPTLADWLPADDLPASLRAVWVEVLKQFPTVRSAYWLARFPTTSSVRRLVVLTGPGEDLPRLMEAMVHVLRDTYAGHLRIEAQAMTQGQLPEAEARIRDFDAFYDASDGPQ